MLIEPDPEDNSKKILQDILFDLNYEIEAAHKQQNDFSKEIEIIQAKRMTVTNSTIKLVDLRDKYLKKL